MSYNGDAFNDDIEDDENKIELPPEPEVHGPLKSVSQYTCLEILALMIGTVAVIMSIINMILNGKDDLKQVVIIAGAFSIALGPYLYIQRNQLVDIEQFKETVEFMELQLNSMEDNIEKLDTNIDGIEESRQNFERMKTTLDVITSLGGQTIEQFAKNIERQRKNVESQGSSLQSQVVNLIMDLVENADTDGDNIFDEAEVDQFLNHLKKLDGVKIYEKRIKRAMIGKSTTTAMDLIHTLHDDNVPEDQILFDIEADN